MLKQQASEIDQKNLGTFLPRTNRQIIHLNFLFVENKMLCAQWFFVYTDDRHVKKTSIIEIVTKTKIGSEK